MKLPLKFIIYPSGLKHYGLKPVLLMKCHLFTKLPFFFSGLKEWHCLALGDIH